MSVKSLAPRRPPRPSAAESGKAASAEPPASVAIKPPETPAAAGSPPGPAAVPATLQELQERLGQGSGIRRASDTQDGRALAAVLRPEDLTTKDAVQQAIAETYIKLQKAQEDETKARRDLEIFLGKQKREPGPSIWIK